MKVYRKPYSLMDDTKHLQPETLSSLANRPDLLEKAASYVRKADADNTLRTYRSGWSHFEEWCQAHGAVSLPARPETVALYLADAAEGYAVATLQSRMSAINRVHKEAGHDAPGQDARVERVWRGIRRSKGTAPKQAIPITAVELRKLLASLPEGLRGSRDRALLLLAFCGAFRRSEIVSLDMEDIRQQREGLRVRLRRSKTDQEGESLEKGISYQSDPDVCPVRALASWIEEARLAEGPVFRSVSRHGRIGQRLNARSVDLIVKRAAAGAGLDAPGFSAHSLRAGLATQAAADGCPERLIAKQGGWQSLSTLRRYIRHGSLFRENVGTYLRLAG